MGKITALKPAVKTENRVNVFIDDKFSFSLDLTQVVDFSLKVGRTLAPAEIEKLKCASTFGKLYTSILEWVLTRPHSVKETRDYLHRKLFRRLTLNKKRERENLSPFELFSEADIESVIKKLTEKNYLNDEKFAKFYVENRNLKKGISVRRLREELRKKGIVPEIINSVLKSSPRNPEIEIEKIIQKKQTKYKTPEKLLAYLLRQGFPYDLVKSKVDELNLPSQL